MFLCLFIQRNKVDQVGLQFGWNLLLGCKIAANLDRARKSRINQFPFDAVKDFSILRMQCRLPSGEKYLIHSRKLTSLRFQGFHIMDEAIHLLHRQIGIVILRWTPEFGPAVKL